MRLLVTGGSGFTGQHTLRRAVEAGHQAFALARSSAAREIVEACGAKAVSGDLDEPGGLATAFQVEADALLNIASLGFGHAPSIVFAAQEAGIRRAVFVSTTAVTTTLAAPSRRMRLAAEETIRTSPLEWTILRPTMIYGAPGDRNLARLLAVLKRTPMLPLPGGGRRLQQPVHVDDLASALLCAVASPIAVGQIYDIAGPEPLSLRQLVEVSAAAVGRNPRLLSIPLGLSIALARIYERGARKPRIKAEQLERLAEDKAFDISSAMRDLRFSPRSFRDGIRAEAAALGL